MEKRMINYKKRLNLKSLFCFIVMFGYIFSGTTQATPITIGQLTYDADKDANIILDSLNDKEWLRWDVLKGLTYAETVTATTTGAYSGWNIAHNSDAQLLTDALLGSAFNDCTVSNTTRCTNNDNMYHELFGDSYSVGSNYDRAFFLSDNGTGDEVGLLKVSLNSYVVKDNEWTAISVSDDYSSNGIDKDETVGWLLYRDVQTVPEPSTLVLLGLGLAGLSSSRRKGFKA